MTEAVENSYPEQSFLIADSALIINNEFALGTSEKIKLTTCSMPEYEKLSAFARKIYRAPLAYLTSRDHDLIVGRDGSTLNMAFETSPRSMLVQTRESVDAKMRIEQAISIVSRSESIRSAYHHGIFIITKEAKRILGTFRPDAAAELAFVEILERNHRFRVCDQSVHGSLRDLRLRIELQERSDSQLSKESAHIEPRLGERPALSTGLKLLG